MNTTSKIKITSKKEDELKNEDSQKNEDDFKNENDLKTVYGRSTHGTEHIPLCASNMIFVVLVI